MRTQRSLLWLAMALMVVGVLALAPVGDVQGQLQDHDPCGNADPEETPTLTCGEFCGAKIVMVGGEPQMQLICKPSPIEDPGWKDCKVELDEEGNQECSVGEKLTSCSIA